MNQISAHSSLRGAHRPLPEDRYREMVYQINDSGASGRVSADWNVGALTPSARIREDACEHVRARARRHHPSSIIHHPSSIIHHRRSAAADTLDANASSASSEPRGPTKLIPMGAELSPAMDGTGIVT